MKKIFTLFLWALIYYNSNAQDNCFINNYYVGSPAKVVEFHFHIASSHKFFIGIGTTDSTKITTFSEIIVKHTILSTVAGGITQVQVDSIYNDITVFYEKYNNSPKLQVIGTGMSGFTSSTPNA